MNTNTWINFTLTLFLWIFIWTFVTTLITMYNISNKNVLIICVVGMFIIVPIITLDKKFTLE
jgi:hypothetical protein